MSRLHEIRLSRAQRAVVAALSAAATALIIANASGRTGAQAAAMQALRHRAVIVEHHPSGAVAAAAQPPSPAGAGATPIGLSSPSTPSAGSQATTPASAPAAASGAAPAAATTAGSAPKSPAVPHHKVRHIFVIALSTPSFDAAFGQRSVAPYLSQTLARRGTVLAGYRSLGASELPDYLAMVSGQSPNPDTQAGCTTYADFPSGAAPGQDGVVPGLGCVYPNTVLTIGDQVTASGHSWRAYIQDMGSSTCVAPNSGAVDNAPLPGAGADYDTRHNPFLYFHSLLDLGGCASNDVSLTQLPTDLRSASRAPTYAFIAPEACLDASAQSCPDGGPSGLAGEDAFLRQWVPRILRSAPYRHGGVLIITFAYAPAARQTVQPGGAPIRTGSLVLSSFARHGKRVSRTYDAYSLLRSVEDLLGYPPLAGARSAGSFVTKVLPGVG